MQFCVIMSVVKQGNGDVNMTTEFTWFWSNAQPALKVALAMSFLCVVKGAEL